MELALLAADDAIPFDPTQVRPPNLDLGLDEREPGGLGLFMVREMSDRMRYDRQDACNRLFVYKRL